MDESTLSASIKAADIHLASLGWWLNFWTIWVIVGCAGELIFVIIGYLDDKNIWHQSRTLGVLNFPERPSRTKLILELLSVALVVIGIAGELYIDAASAKVLSDQRTDNGKLIALYNVKASTANERAGKLEKEAAQIRKDAAELEDSISWRRIPPNRLPSIAARLREYKGQVAWITYNMNDVEANDFGVGIAALLKLSDWIPTEPEPLMKMFEGPVNFGTNILPRGIVVSSNPDPSSEEAAKALVQELVNAGFDVIKSPIVPPLGNTPGQAVGVNIMRGSAGNFGKRAIVYVSVEPRPNGPQGDAKLRAAKKKQQASATTPKK